MADNILDASSCQSKRMRLDYVTFQSKTMRLDSYHEDGGSSSVDTEMFVDPRHPNTVLEGLNRLRLSGTLCDVVLCCEGRELPCHRYVLASFSSYFEAMFTSGMREATQERVTISGVEPHIVGLLVDYAYTSKVSISTANVQALLSASNLLDVLAVRRASCDYMTRHMDVNNCIGVYCVADAHNCEALAERSMDFILDHFIEVYQQEEFLSLSVERLTDILSSDHLNVTKEDMVFDAAMLWLHKCPTRKQSFEKVLEQIRLPLISSPYLYTLIEALDAVKEQPGCQRFISEAQKRPYYCNTARPRRTTVIVILGGGTRAGPGGVHKVDSLNPLTNQWKAVGRLPLKLCRHAVATSGSFLYLAGGADGSRIGNNYDSYSRNMWRYDVDQNSWMKMAPMNEPRNCLSLVCVGGCVFAVGGHGSDRSNDSMERYDPDTNTWTLLQSAGVVQHSPATVVALHGLIYFIGDAPRETNPPKVAKFNPETSVWTDVSPMRVPRKDAAVCCLNGKIYLIGGREGTVERTGLIRQTHVMVSSVECYNPNTDRWSGCAPLLAERYGHSAVAVDGKIYVLGGRDHIDAYPTNMEVYCEEKDRWKNVGHIPPGRYDLICDAPRETNPPKVAKFNPETSVWTDVSPMRLPRKDAAVCCLNGKIYLIGGREGTVERTGLIRQTHVMVSSVECYNPNTDRWSGCASLLAERYGHSAVAVDGKIYVLGGRDHIDAYPTNMEVYCEEKDRWKNVGHIPPGRYDLICESLRLRRDHVPKQ